MVPSFGRLGFAYQALPTTESIAAVCCGKPWNSGSYLAMCTLSDLGMSSDIPKTRDILKTRRHFFCVSSIVVKPSG